MKKTIKLQNLDCANCASKIENTIAKLDGVINVKVNFMGQRMILETADDRFDNIFSDAKKAARRIESDLVFLD